MFPFVALVFSLLILVQAGVTSNLSSDKHAINAKAFVEIGGRNYYVASTNNRVTKSEADVFCKDLGMELLSLETEEESNSINDYLFEQAIVRAAHWTSGITTVEGQWHWMASDQPFTYTNWGRNEPKSEEPGNCVLVMYAEFWIGETCEGVATFICEQQP